MKAATAGAGSLLSTISTRQELWLDFYRALGQRNFVRAIALARQLGIDEKRIRRIERDALKQFLIEYQNFEAASLLCAAYGFTAAELHCLTAEILERQELESQRTFTLQAGSPAHLSIAEQIRSFARRQLESLSKQHSLSTNGGRLKRLRATLKAWFESLSNPWSGSFPHDGLAHG